MDLDKPDGATELPGLDLGELASPARPERDGGWLRKTAFLALLPLLMIAAVAGVFHVGKAMLFPSTAAEVLGPSSPKGHCSILDRNWCTSLDLHYIESFAGVELPDDTDVIDSGSWRSLKGGREWATVRLPEGTSISNPGTHADGSDYRTEIQVGLGPDGRQLLTIERFWDG